MKHLISIVVALLCRFVSGASNVAMFPKYSYRVKQVDK